MLHRLLLLLSFFFSFFSSLPIPLLALRVSTVVVVAGVASTCKQPARARGAFDGGWMVR